MKKIIYIYIGVDLVNNSSGVQKKILSKIKAINELGVFCQGVSFSNNITAPLIINEYLTVIPFEKKTRKYFNSFYQQKLVFIAISKYLNSQIKSFTHVLFRYPLASSPLLRLTKKFNKKFVFEHNTKEIEEVALQAKLFRSSLKFSIKPGYFIYLLERGYLTILQEKVLGKKIFKYSKSGIAVTSEIAEYEKTRQSKYKINVVTNGIEVGKSKLRTPIDFNGLELKLFMLLGSQNVWHGVDRLVKSIANYKGTCLIKIDLIGSISKEDERLIDYYNVNDRIRIMPSVNSETLNQCLNEYHLGIGTLAAFRKGLKEATPLKTREYMARGFAAIIGYEDTDFENHSEFKKYCLQVKPDESLIDFEVVVEFARNIFREENHHLKIRELAVKYLDTKVKMQQLVQLLD